MRSKLEVTIYYVLIILVGSFFFSACKNPFSKEDTNLQNTGTSSGITLGSDLSEDSELPYKLLKTISLWDSKGKVVVGKMEDYGNWDLNTAFSGPGYYNSISNLPTASDICINKTILGVTGAAICQNGTLITPAASADILSGLQVWDSTGNILTGSMPNRGNLDASQSFPGNGYYTGVINNIPNASLVCTGNTILGVNGTAVCQIDTTVSPAGAGNILAGLEAWSALGTKLTGTMPNRGNLDATQSFPGSGFYSGSINNPNASNICIGNTILGVSGTATCGIPYSIYSSNANRDKNTAQISQSEETTTYAGIALPAQYREMPMVSKDDDGTFSTNATKVVRSSFVNCGLTQTTIALRIADCANLNGVNAIWDGQVKGNNGFGVWKLVTRTASNIEVWRDDRTGLLWSSKIIAATNWCRASGNNNSSTVTNLSFKDSDPSGTCTNVAYQNTTSAPFSMCLENPEFNTSYVNAAGKGGLKASSTPAVRWRLPTRNDYLQAQINGLNLVLPDLNSTYEWTATIHSSNIANAWVYRNSSLVSTSPRSNGSRAVRCVGR